ncbi:MAG: universal stress protein [Pseudomonadota bacterium]
MSKKVEKILCCIAMSETTTEEVMLRTLHEAGAHDARVHILHILPVSDATVITPIVNFMGEEKYRQLVKEHKEETVQAIKEEIIELKDRIIAEHLDESVDRIEEIHVFEGDPELEILHMADILKVDMLVMGTHTKGLTHYTFMGSVARKVIKRTRIPVLLVPPPTP